MPVPVLMTKLYVPPVRSELVLRPRLLNRLNEGLTGKLTLVSAPAGFGKTTLIAEWLQQKDEGKGTSRKPLPPSTFVPHPARIAWISLDEGDNDLVRFLTYLITALQTVQPDIGRSALELLHSPQLPPMEVIFTGLINDILTLDNVPPRIILVLDDYHTLSNQDIHASVAFLLEHKPPQLHLIIASRIDPPLALARLRARHQLIEFRDDDLRFTPDEAAEFLNRVMGLKLSEDNIATLETRTEGWIAGLQLAALSMQGRTNFEEFIAGFTGSHQYVLDYLAQEVFHQQPEEIQDFLLRTSILDQLTAPLCNAITGRTDSQVMLERLAGCNLFILPLDDRREWYRYHRLFADLLQHHLAQTALDVQELYRRAAAWCNQAGVIEKAVKYALAAKDYEQVERYILTSIKDILSHSEKALLLESLEAIPEAWLTARPLLCLIKAWGFFFDGKIEASKQNLHLAEQSLATFEIDEAVARQFNPDFDSRHIPGFVTALKAQIALIQGEITRSIDFSLTALKYLPESLVGLRGLIVQNLGVAYWLTGDIEAADNTLKQAKVLSRADDDLAALLAIGSLADQHRLRGHIIQAASLYRRVLQLAETQRSDRDFSFIRAQAHADLGIILYEWNELEAAEYHLREGIRVGERGIGMRAIGAGYFGLTQLLRAKGDLEGAFAAGEKFSEGIRNLDTGIPVSLFNLMHLPLWIAKNDIERVKQAVELYDDLPISGQFSPPVMRAVVNLAYAHLVLSNPDTTVRMATELLLQERFQREPSLTIELRMLLALAYQAQGQIDQALAEIRDTLSQAEPENYIRSFVDKGPPMLSLLLKLLNESSPSQSGAAPSGAYIHTLLAAFGVENQSPATASLSNQPQIEPLTERELEVLRLLADGLSNREIAETLVISPGTVKAHTKHIYGKLDVNNRTQAAAKARALGLLP